MYQGRADVGYWLIDESFSNHGAAGMVTLFRKRPEFQLFAPEKDLEAMTNHATNPEYAARVNALHALIQEWIQVH